MIFQILLELILFWSDESFGEIDKLRDLMNVETSFIVMQWEGHFYSCACVSRIKFLLTTFLDVYQIFLRVSIKYFSFSLTKKNKYLSR